MSGLRIQDTGCRLLPNHSCGSLQGIHFGSASSGFPAKRIGLGSHGQFSQSLASSYEFANAALHETSLKLS